MKKLVIVLLFLSFFTLSAQTKFGVTAGMNIANMKFKYDGMKHPGSFIPRVQLGTILEIPINDNWLLHTSPYYSGKGCRYGNTLSIKNDSERIHLNYIELPVQVMYKFPGEYNNKVLIGGGLYVGYGFNGEILYKRSPERTQTHLHKKDSIFKRWDFGYSINGSYHINNKYGIKAGFSHSLMNMYRDRDNTSTSKNMVFTLSLFGFIGKRGNDE